MEISQINAAFDDNSNFKTMQQHLTENSGTAIQFHPQEEISSFKNVGSRYSEEPSTTLSQAQRVKKEVKAEFRKIQNGEEEIEEADKPLKVNEVMPKISGYSEEETMKWINEFELQWVEEN